MIEQSKDVSAASKDRPVQLSDKEAAGATGGVTDSVISGNTAGN